MSEFVDYYALLEVSPRATAEEIEAAYERLIRAWHPANYPAAAPPEVQDLAAGRTKQLIEARQTLLAPERRRAFDEQRAAVLTRGSASEDHRQETSATPPTRDVIAFPPAPAARAPEASAVVAEHERSAAPGEHLGTGRLIAWLALAALLAAGGFAAGTAKWQPTGDEAYRYSTAIVGIVFTGVLLALILWIAPGIRVRDLLALRRPAWPRDVLALRPPTAWAWALGVGAAIVVGSFVFDYLYDRLFGPFEVDQGIATFWDGSRAPQFVLNFLVLAVLVPIEEELMYRGLGFALLERFGTWTAIVGTAALFALSHGYLTILPIFLVAGLALAWLRARTGSVYPGMLVHGVFNGSVVILAVAFG